MSKTFTFPILFILLLVSEIAYSQLMSSDTCIHAPVICDIKIDLDNFVGRTGALPNTIPDVDEICPGVGGTIENISWFAFVAGSDSIEIEIIPFNCTQPNSNTTLRGIQAGIVTNCNLSQPITCFSTQIYDARPIRIGAKDFVIGQTYYFWVDGQAGSICDYRLKIITGDQAFPLPKITQAPYFLTGGGSQDFDTVCLGYEMFPITLHNFAPNVDFFWKISPGTTQYPADTFFRAGKTTLWDFDVAGTYDISLYAYNGCTYTDTLVKRIVVTPIANEDFGTIEICPNQYSDLPSIFRTLDPNGDGDFGYKGPVPFTSGSYPHTVEYATGCMYVQDLVIKEKPFNYTRTKDTLYSCGPIDYHGTIISQTVESMFINIEDASSVGCDSLVDITAYILNVTGDIGLGSCTNDGSELVFHVSGLSLDVGGYSLRYQWKDGAGNPLNDANGPDSTLVVTATDSYSIDVYLNSGGVECMFTFGPYDYDLANAGPSLPAVLKFQDYTCSEQGLDTFEIAGIPTYNYLWELPLGTQIVEQSDGFLVVDFANASSGNVCVFVTNSCGASEKYCQFITKHETPQLDLMAGALVMCEDSTVSISVSGNAPPTFNYLWNIADGNLIQGSQNSPSDVVIQFLNPGQKDIFLEASHQDCETINYPLSIDVKESSKVVPISCVPTSNQIKFSWPQQECDQWYIVFVNGVIHTSTSVPEVIVHNLEANTTINLEIQVINSCGCDDVYLTTTCTTIDCSDIEVSIDQQGLVLCEDMWEDSIPLSATVIGATFGDRLSWRGPGVDINGGFSPKVAGAGVHNVIVDYFWKVHENSEEGCLTSDTITYTLTESPDAQITTIDPTCQDEILGQFFISAIGGAGNYKFLMDGKEGLSSGDASVGTHQITVIDGNNCSVSKTFTIQNALIPQYSITGIREYFEDEEMFLELDVNSSESPAIDSVVWFIEGEPICSGINCFSIRLSELLAGVYDHQIIVYFEDCQLEEEFVISVSSISSFQFPTVFSPNGDGYNDKLIATSNANQSLKSFRVYSRWGQLLSEAKDVPADAQAMLWDGKTNGQTVQPGVYVYIAQYVNERGVEETLVGNITIIH